MTYYDGDATYSYHDLEKHCTKLSNRGSTTEYNIQTTQNVWNVYLVPIFQLLDWYVVFRIRSRFLFTSLNYTYLGKSTKILHFLSL